MRIWLIAAAAALTLAGDAHANLSQSDFERQCAAGLAESGKRDSGQCACAAAQFSGFSNDERLIALGWATGRMELYNQTREIYTPSDIVAFLEQDRVGRIWRRCKW